MSWFAGSAPNTQELDDKIQEATSESIPNGEYDVAVAYEITDIIRSKKIPAKQCMRSLKKRLTNTYQNPNMLMSTLKLIDVCVKNSGYHFLVELSSKEFIDYLVDYVFKVKYNTQDNKIMYNEAKLSVGNYILMLIKNWTIYFKNQMQLNYVESVYNDLLRKGYEFPETDTSEYSHSVFIDTETPADWIDNDECMICYKPFSMMNRKHHCRSCGGVFCQEHSSHSIPLPSLGILEAVRVCDNCHFKEKYKLQKNPNLSLKNKPHGRSKSKNVDEDQDEDLKRAIELSLQESGVASTPQAQPPAPPPVEPSPAADEEEDEEMKAAIAASLKEFQAQEQARQPAAPVAAPTPSAPEEPQSEFYNNILPFDKYSQAQSQSSHPQAYPQAQANAFQSPSQGLTPSQHIQKHLQTEDLSQKEEEAINLYITLVNQMKTDKTRQANILYDKDLNDLHTQVVQIKPKLNKALRNSIERYEKFVALNNKISTITKLYDEFLESKLSQAYGNHSLYSPGYPTQNQGYYPPSQYTGQASIPPQSTSQSHQMPVYGQNEVTGQYTGAPTPTPPQLTGSVPHSRGQRSTSQSDASFARQSQPEPYSTNAEPQYTAPSEPQFSGTSDFNAHYPPVPPGYATGNSAQPTGSVPPPQVTGSMPQQYGSAPSQPVFEESEPSYEQPTSYPPRGSTHEETYSNVASYPPIDTGDTHTAPNFPPYPSNSPPKEESQQFNHTGGSMESTRSRYPPVEDVGSAYPTDGKQGQEGQSSSGQVASMPSVPHTSFNEPPKRVEEALIEL